MILLEFTGLNKMLTHLDWINSLIVYKFKQGEDNDAKGINPKSTFNKDLWYFKFLVAQIISSSY